jgi:Uma2 family endonuclease
MADDAFEEHIRMMPEPKLELLGGRFLVGNGAGNMQLLRHLLEGWGAEAAVPMAPRELWLQALRQGFGEFDPPAPEKPLAVWQAWAAQLAYAPSLAPAGPMLDRKHGAARERLMMSLFRLAEDRRAAHVCGRDVVMCLEEDALTPDVFAVGPGQAPRLNDYYLDGPAELVIEVLLPGHETYDREVKARRYAAGGVAEYWLIDPHRQTAEFFRLAGDQYQPCPLGADGKYRPASFPGLAFQPGLLWDGNDWGRGPSPFSAEADLPTVPKGFAESTSGWGDLPFDPQPGLGPRRLSFAEFISWAPRAKFEVIGGKPWVGGSRGSRNTIGFLLRTEGLARAVTVLHPRAWVGALVRAEAEAATDGERRQRWWGVARQVAAELRERFGFGRLVVIGDLVREAPLNLWSDIRLVAFDLTKEHDTWEAARFLYKRFREEVAINLIEHERASRSEKAEVSSAGVDV